MPQKSALQTYDTCNISISSKTISPCLGSQNWTKNR
uniref:Uncharacterized protein n=1 Tax=Arundo donax TaxID=35708 RepID=A0A0A8ZK88_ARUDO